MKSEMLKCTIDILQSGIMIIELINYETLQRMYVYL